MPHKSLRVTHKIYGVPLPVFLLPPLLTLSGELVVVII